ncbi:Aquaporin-1 [Fonsecaea pedrosoi]|nr:Aquaporin-1 [Fonsecaea pedrosoi]
MDRISPKSGFLPGIFGRRKGKSRTGATPAGEDEKMQGPKPSSFFLRIPNKPRNHFIAMAGEFVGTFLFLFFAFAGTQVANTPQTVTGNTSTDLPQGPNPIQLLYISLCFGFSLAVNAWIFFRISGGLFNPAVTLGLCLIGAVPFVRGALVFIAQMLGAMASAGVVKALFPGPLAVTTSLSGGTNKAQGLFIEMFLTAQLVFTIFMLAAEKHKGTFLAPVGIGLSLFIAELAGPLLGSLVASGFFWFIKSCEYQTANPGQDFDDLEASAYNPEEDLTRPVVSPTAVIPDRALSRTSRTSKERSSKDERSGSLQATRIGSGTTNTTLSNNNTNGNATFHDRTTIPSQSAT